MVLNKFINNVKSLDTELKNILLISNLFFISNMFINNFMGIIVFKENNSFQNLIEYYFFLTFFSAITMLLAIKYCPIFKLNIKTIVRISSFIILISYIYLLFTYQLNKLNFNIFIIINSIGNAFLWYFINLNEIRKTNKENRMLYISITQFLKQSLNVIVPLLISILIIISIYFNFKEYLILILFLILIFIIILINTNNIDNYYPKKIVSIKLEKSKFKHYLYNFLNGTNTFGFLFLYIYLTSIIFKNIETIGFYWFIINFISMFIIMYLSNNLNKNIKDKMFKYSYLFILISLIPILFEINFMSYMFYTIIFSIFFPIFLIYAKNVSIKTTKLIFINKNNSLFIREIFLNLGRFLSIFIIFTFFYFFGTSCFLILFIIYLLLFFSFEYFLNKSYN